MTLFDFFSRMRHLIAETERRQNQGQEYVQLLVDIEQHYLTCRSVHKIIES